MDHAMTARSGLGSAAQRADVAAQELLRLTQGRISQVRINRNRGMLLSLRGQRGAWRLSVHQDLLGQPEVPAEIAAWVRGEGRTVSAGLRQAMDVVMGQRAVHAREQLHQRLGPLPTLNGPLDLPATAERIHRTWFAHLPVIPMTWGPRQKSGPRRRIRFGAYHRTPAHITINRLVDQPWVAQVFVDYLLFHELCHHAQACTPMRGETAHSPRFKAWERRFPALDQALAWEKAHLDRFLGL